MVQPSYRGLTHSRSSPMWAAFSSHFSLHIPISSLKRMTALVTWIFLPYLELVLLDIFKKKKSKTYKFQEVQPYWHPLFFKNFHQKICRDLKKKKITEMYVCIMPLFPHFPSCSPVFGSCKRVVNWRKLVKTHTLHYLERKLFIYCMNWSDPLILEVVPALTNG